MKRRTEKDKVFRRARPRAGQTCAEVSVIMMELRIKRARHACARVSVSYRAILCSQERVKAKVLSNQDEPWRSSRTSLDPVYFLCAGFDLMIKMFLPLKERERREISWQGWTDKQRTSLAGGRRPYCLKARWWRRRRTRTRRPPSLSPGLTDRLWHL